MEEVGLNKVQFPSMGMDGPNKTIWKHLNDHLKSLGFLGLVEFMPCIMVSSMDCPSMVSSLSIWQYLISSTGSKRTQPAKKITSIHRLTLALMNNSSFAMLIADG